MNSRKKYRFLVINFVELFQFEPPQECLYLLTRLSIAFALSDRLRPILSGCSLSDAPPLFLPLFHLLLLKWAIHLFSTQPFTLGPLSGWSLEWISSFKKRPEGAIISVLHLNLKIEGLALDTLDVRIILKHSMLALMGNKDLIFWILNFH